MSFKFSDEQNKIFEVAATGRNICIEAGAGAAKTTSVLEMASRLSGTTAYIVFNKAAQEDALKRIRAMGLEGKIVPTTIHALAYRGTPIELREHMYDKTVSRDVQIYRLLKGTKDVHVGQQGSRIRIPKDTLNYLATSSFRAFCLSGDSTPSRSCIQHLDGIDDLDSTDNNDKLAGYVLPLVRKLWDDCLGEGLVKLNHDTYLKRWSEVAPDIVGDCIVQDESQDSNAVNTNVLLYNHHKHGTQLVVVGDQRQRLYSFRLVSDPSPHIPKAVRLTLSQTYRCGPTITDLANAIPRAATNSMVLVGNQEVDAVVNRYDGPNLVDAILCRTNTSVVSAAFDEVGSYVDAGNSGPFPLVCMTDGCKSEAKELIAAYGKASEGKVVTEGTYRGIRDLGGLQAKIGVLVIPRTRALQVHLGETTKEVRMSEQDDDASTSHLVEVFKLVSEYGVELARRVFDARGKKDRVHILTVHQAKGLEWDSVKIWSDLAPKEETPGIVTDDEKCSLYVAVTRARSYLDISCNYYLQGLINYN